MKWARLVAMFFFCFNFCSNSNNNDNKKQKNKQQQLACIYGDCHEMNVRMRKKIFHPILQFGMKSMSASNLSIRNA